MGLPFADTSEIDLVSKPSSTHEKTVHFADNVVEHPYAIDTFLPGHSPIARLADGLPLKRDR